MIERMRRRRRRFFSSLYEHMHPFFRDTLYLLAQLFGHVEIGLLAGLLRQTLELIDIPVPIVFEGKPDFLFKNKNSSLHQIVCLLKWLRNAPTKSKFGQTANIVCICFLRHFGTFTVLQGTCCQRRTCPVAKVDSHL